MCKALEKLAKQHEVQAEHISRSYIKTFNAMRMILQTIAQNDSYIKSLALRCFMFL